MSDRSEEQLVLVAQEGKKMVEDGKHIGSIIDVLPKTITKDGKDIPYMDIILTVADVDSEGNSLYEYKDEDDNSQLQTLRVGCSQKITPNSNLGKLLKSLGYDIGAGSKHNVADIIGTDITYQTVEVEGTNRDGQKQMFSNVMIETIKKA